MKTIELDPNIILDKLSEKCNPKEILEETIMIFSKAIGIRVTERGLPRFAKWMIKYEKESVFTMDDDDIAKVLVMKSLISPSEFSEILRRSILKCGALELIGTDLEEAIL